MEFEFDKEIDALLRRARSGEAAFSGITSITAGELKSAHLDADDISAFAENALPEKTKILYTAHLADCSRCRKILSDIISLNSEAESPAASSAITAPENFAAASAVPWYRKLFVFPQLTYAMGGLVLIFSGFLVYFVLQNSGRNAENSSISQMKERPQGMKGASSDGETTTVETSRSAANSASAQPAMNTAVSNSAANTATGPTSMANSPANSNASVSRKELTEREKEPEATPVPGPPAPPPPTTVSENQTATGGARPGAPALQNQPIPVPAETKTTDEESARAENKKEKDSTDDVALADRRLAKSATKPSAKMTAEGESKQAAGKTFTRRNGVWYDPDYKGQSTTNVARGSDDYKKLDSGLRSIAAGFGGTVVIVYKGKAYRIQ